MLEFVQKICSMVCPHVLFWSFFIWECWWSPRPFLSCSPLPGPTLKGPCDVLTHLVGCATICVWEIPNIFMHYLPDKKLRHSNVPGFEPNWFARVIVNHGLNLTNKFESSFLIRTMRVNLSSFIISIELIQLFCNLLYCCQIDTQSEIFILKFLTWMSISTICHFPISGGVNCIMALLSSQTMPNGL